MNKKLKMSFIISLSLFLSFVIPFNSKADELEQFLEKNVPTLKVLIDKRNSFQKNLGVETKEATSPKLFSDLNFSFGEQRDSQPLVFNDHYSLLSLQAGLKKQNINGTYFQFGYRQIVSDFSDTRFLNVSNFSYTAPTSTKSYSGSPFAIFGMPLISGFGGKSISYVVEAANVSEELELIGLELKMVQKKDEVKNLIWNYSYYLQLIGTLEESLGRVRGLYSIVKRKVDLKIEEPGSLYQIEAAIRSSEVELLNFKKEISEIEKKLESEGVFPLDIFKRELLSTKDESNFMLKQFSLRGETCQKLLAANLEMLTSSKKIEDSRVKLDLLIKGSLFEESSRLGQSITKSIKLDKPEIIIGLNLFVELDRDITKSVQEKNSVVKMNVFSEKKILIEKEKKEFEIIKDKLKNEIIVKESLEKLKNIQLAKLLNEIRLLNLGRSSLFQVLQFENEFIRSSQAYLSQHLQNKNTLNQLNNFKFSLKE